MSRLLLFSLLGGFVVFTAGAFIGGVLTHDGAYGAGMRTGFIFGQMQEFNNTMQCELNLARAMVNNTRLRAENLLKQMNLDECNMGLEIYKHGAEACQKLREAEANLLKHTNPSTTWVMESTPYPLPEVEE